MKKITIQISIPEGLDFQALDLARDPGTGGITFRLDAIKRICAASEIDPALLLESHEDNVAGLIVAWYTEHRARGGDPDPVAEDLIREALAEDLLGGGISHQPGRA
ncbi:MAG TPA: hypothetical protein VNL74_00985 [Methylococcus sp.]|nr:hypothetical protein [Methylococcus sp.]